MKSNGRTVRAVTFRRLKQAHYHPPSRRDRAVSNALGSWLLLFRMATRAEERIRFSLDKPIRLRQ
jgi:hypothetical protein